VYIFARPAVCGCAERTTPTGTARWCEGAGAWAGTPARVASRIDRFSDRSAIAYTAELRSDMKWDRGIALRAMIQRAVFRADGAASDEGARFIAVVSHPF